MSAPRTEAPHPGHPTPSPLHPAARDLERVPIPEGEEIDIWMADHLLRPSWEAHLDRLSSLERKRAEAFRFADDRRRFVGSRLVLRSVLARYTGRAPELLEFAADPAGKPHLRDQPGAGLSFNLSRSGDMTVVAVAAPCGLGVDVEAMRPDRPNALVAERRFTTAERDYVKGAPDSTQAFYEIWTRKEAYIKAIGHGLSHPLASFDVTPSDLADPTLVDDWSERRPEGRWWVMSVDMARPGFPVAVCSPHPRPRIRLHATPAPELVVGTC